MSLFFESDSALSEVISIESPAQARHSVRSLRQMFRQRQREGQVEILRAANLAANRAVASLQKSNVSLKERRQMRGVAGIYRRAVKWFSNHLRGE